jgi:transposase
MSFAIALSDEQWELVADLFNPPGRHGAPAVIPRHQMVDAMLFIARAGCQWRYLPERLRGVDRGLGQWPRWRANEVWATAMARLTAIVRGEVVTCSFPGRRSPKDGSFADGTSWRMPPLSSMHRQAIS